MEKRPTCGVLHVIDHLGLGGAQTAVLTQLLHRPGDQVLVLKESGTRKLNGAARAGLVWRGAATPAGLLLILPRLLLAIHRHRVKILHCHLRYSWLFGLLASYLSPVKVVFHERGWILFDRPIYRRLVKLCAGRGRLVAVSQYCAKRLGELGVAQEQVNVVHNGLDHSQFYIDRSNRATVRRVYGIPETATLAGFAGRLVSYKGWRAFVESLALLNGGHGCRVFGVMAGAGADAPEVRNRIRELGLENRIVMLDIIDDMRDFYNAIDILVVPSRLEPHGRVQLEAQACGVPVVAAKIDGMGETLSDDNAILIGSGTAADYAAAIGQIIADPVLAKRLVREGLKNVRNFDHVDYINNIEAVYASLADV